MGNIMPILCEEVLPGDTWSMSQEVLLRVQPLIAPVMQRFNVLLEAYFVPSRILWKDYEFWQFQQKELTDADYPKLKLIAENDYSIYREGTLFDFLGCFPSYYDDASAEWKPDYDYNEGYTDNRINALPFAAYQKIYYEYYRDQNLIDPDQDDVEFEWVRDGLPNGELSNTIPNAQQFQGLLKLRKRSWRKDYFTAALPFAQKGDSVMMPLNFSNAIEANGNLKLATTLAPDDPKEGLYMDTYNGNVQVNGGSGPGWIDVQYFDGLAINSEAVNGTINELRTAFQVQKWLELNAVGGTRYVEGLQKHFGVSPSDGRLQRPELIGMSSAPVVISEVLQTTPTVEVSGELEGALGDFAGHGISAHRHKYFKYNAEEFGYIIVLLTVMPEASYFQGMKKLFDKKRVFDFAFPSFANLGEQEILRKELVFNGLPAYDSAVFGYTPRYAEYKFINSRVAGQFRSSLNFWHYGRILDNGVSLNTDFIEYSNDKRIFAVIDEDEDELIIHVNHSIIASRPLPKFGTPISLK